MLTESAAGLGGVDEATLAAALCREHAQTLDIVWWLRAETETPPSSPTWPATLAPPASGRCRLTLVFCVR